MSPMVPAVERAMRILNAFKDGRVEYGVSELSHTLDINKSTVHGIVRTLSEYRMLEQDPSTRKYRLGPGLIELGGLARARRDVRDVAHPFTTDLMELTRETVLLGVFEDDGITIIDAMQPARELRITAAPGQRLPYSAGSFGRAFLAWMREEQVDRLIATYGLRRFTDTTLTDPARYEASLEKVRREGYAVDDSEEYLEGVWAVSAPIHDEEGILAVLTVVGFTGRMEDDAKSSAIEAANRAARQISRGMGAPSERIR
ncbi:MAG: HTH-type transcriptional repressor AllR [Anaerolineae bacterium]|nr:MAG: HTH-type transcriptional repressor AllR [Anaerolineae bacterium]